MTIHGHPIPIHRSHNAQTRATVALFGRLPRATIRIVQYVLKRNRQHLGLDIPGISFLLLVYFFAFSLSCLSCYKYVESPLSPSYEYLSCKPCLSKNDRALSLPSVANVSYVIIIYLYSDTSRGHTYIIYRGHTYIVYIEWMMKECFCFVCCI